jgi:tRNA pseudouridine13 synthase
MKSSTFQYAGTKDKRAITSQLVTASKVLPKRLLGVRDNRYACGNFSFVNKPLRLGALKVFSR